MPDQETTDRYLRQWQSQKGDIKAPTSLHKAVNKNNPTAQQAQEAHDDVFEKMDCLQCANCCKSIPPIVSKRDIKRIASTLNMSVSDFEVRYTILDEDGDRVMNASPCPFLEKDNACRIYEVRPYACRAYPHSGNFEFLKNKNHHKRNTQYCPALLAIMKKLESNT